MAKIELTIEKQYVSWGLWEAARELMQNGLDAQVDGCRFEVTYEPVQQRLSFVTEGAVLDNRSLLLGASSKRDRDDQIGKFGEGYKLGLLALVNNDHPVVIRTGDQRWVPRIEASAKFGGAEVLVIDQKPGARPFKNSIEIEVGRVPVESWRSLCCRFLCLSPPQDAVRTGSGTILRDEYLRGKVFVGGIYVESLEDLSFGYDLPPRAVKLDRDRRMVDRWDLEWNTAKVWAEAVSQDTSLLPTLMQLLTDDRADTKKVRHCTALTKSTRSLLASMFKQTHGDGALAVSSKQEEETAKALNRVGVTVPAALREVLEGELGTLAQEQSRLRTEVVDIHATEDLTDEELRNFVRARDLVLDARRHLSADQFWIVTFRDPNLNGLWVPTEPGRRAEVQIARHRLGSLKAALRTIIHEAAHDTSGSSDGTVDFERALQNLWSDVADSLL